MLVHIVLRLFHQEREYLIEITTSLMIRKLSNTHKIITVMNKRWMTYMITR